MTRKYYTSDSTLSKIQRAFSEFLLLPSIIVIGFLLLSYWSYNIDHEKIRWLQPFRQVLRIHIFSDAKSTASLLSAIVSGTISITSLTTTLLLVIVQQSAGSMTTQVFDQFLRRRTNQFYLGFFVGLALYSMITLATVNDPFNPVIGGALSFLLTGMALCMLVVLMYTTIDQMRPAEIINAIYERIMLARNRQGKMMAYTVEEFAESDIKAEHLICKKGGFLTHINTKKLSSLLQSRFEGSKVAFNCTVGDYIALNNTIASIYASKPEYIDHIKVAILKCLKIQVQRDIDFDVAFGIEQLEIIGWTSTSTAKSNPAPAKLCISNIQNVIACWSDSDIEKKENTCQYIAYKDDVFSALLNTLESLMVASSESMQHQVFVAVLDTITNTIPNVPANWTPKMEQLVLRMLSVMGDMVMTDTLNVALQRLMKELSVLKLAETYKQVNTAYGVLKNSVGKLNSRSTRVPV